MKSVDIDDAKSQLSKLVVRVLAGEDVVITRAGKPVVRLTPIDSDEMPRQGGQWKGLVRIADDFDALPDEVASAFGIDPE